MSNRIYIGVDPDVDKSGFAISQVVDGKRQYKTLSMTFFEAYNYFVELFWNSENPNEIKAYVECGYLRKKNNYYRRLKPSYTPQEVSNFEATANKVGRNGQIQRLYVQMFEFMGIEVIEYIPDNSPKISKEETYKRIKIKPKNQDQADALWLIYGMN